MFRQMLQPLTEWFDVSLHGFNFLAKNAAYALPRIENKKMYQFIYKR